MRSIVLLASSLLWVVPSPAAAQGCPDGDWFCEPAPEPPPAADAEATAPPSEEPAAQRPPKVARWRGEFLPEPPPPEAPRRRRPRRHRWGFDIHLLGAVMAGDDVHPDAGMGGIGFGLRYRPIPHFALDASLELAFGTDYNGFDRTETAALANAVGFLNPRNPVQFYVLAGLGLSSAEVSRGRGDLEFYEGDVRYSYFGMQAGAGIEARLTRRAAFRFDVIGFVRGRTDDRRREQPEFVDFDQNRVTNTSGGAFARGGAVFYW